MVLFRCWLDYYSICFDVQFFRCWHRRWYWPIPWSSRLPRHLSLDPRIYHGRLHKNLEFRQIATINPITNNLNRLFKQWVINSTSLFQQLTLKEISEVTVTLNLLIPRNRTSRAFFKISDHNNLKSIFRWPFLLDYLFSNLHKFLIIIREWTGFDNFDKHLASWHRTGANVFNSKKLKLNHRWCINKRTLKLDIVIYIIYGFSLWI